MNTVDHWRAGPGAMRTAPPFLDFTNNTTGHVIACQQFRWPTRITVAHHVLPAFFRVVRSLMRVKLGNIVKHKTATLVVFQDTSFAPHTFRDQDASDTGRPDHAGWVKLDKLHVNQVGSAVICQ